MKDLRELQELQGIEDWLIYRMAEAENNIKQCENEQYFAGAVKYEIMLDAYKQVHKRMRKTIDRLMELEK